MWGVLTFALGIHRHDDAGCGIGINMIQLVQIFVFFFFMCCLNNGITVLLWL